MYLFIYLVYLHVCILLFTAHDCLSALNFFCSLVTTVGLLIGFCVGIPVLICVIVCILIFLVECITRCRKKVRSYRLACPPPRNSHPYVPPYFQPELHSSPSQVTPPTELLPSQPHPPPQRFLPPPYSQPYPPTPPPSQPYPPPSPSQPSPPPPPSQPSPPPPSPSQPSLNPAQSSSVQTGDNDGVLLPEYSCGDEPPAYNTIY